MSKYVYHTLIYSFIYSTNLRKNIMFFFTYTCEILQRRKVCVLGFSILRIHLNIFKQFDRAHKFHFKKKANSTFTFTSLGFLFSILCIGW